MTDALPLRLAYGKRLRKLRNDAGWSMGDVARLLRGTTVEISNVELGRSPPWGLDITELLVGYLLGLPEGQKKVPWTDSIVRELLALAAHWTPPPPEDAERGMLVHTGSHEENMAAFSREEDAMRIATLERQVEALRNGLLCIMGIVANDLGRTLADVRRWTDYHLDRALLEDRTLIENAPIVPPLDRTHARHDGSEWMSLASRLRLAVAAWEHEAGRKRDSVERRAKRTPEDPRVLRQLAEADVLTLRAADIRRWLNANERIAFYQHPGTSDVP